MKILLLAAIACASYGQDLRGVVDIHVHSDPDSKPRSIDAIAITRLAREQGMRAMVLKNHYEPTASLAYVARKAEPGIEVFGGIALNRSVGGINPAAVEQMTLVKGGWGRVVWMPTFDAENQVRFSKEDRPFVSIARNGALLPNVEEILGIAASKNLVIATGHSSAEEALIIVREAKRLNVAHVVVTHAMLAPVSMNVAQMRRAAEQGAYIEFVYNALIGPGKSFEIGQYAKAIREVGVDHVILSSDLGQAGNPLHPDGLLAFFAALRQNGFTVAEVERMSKTNPARLLGLDQP